MVPAATHPLGDEKRCKLDERLPSRPAAAPLVDKLVHDQDAHLVAQIQQSLGIWVVCAAVYGRLMRKSSGKSTVCACPPAVRSHAQFKSTTWAEWATPARPKATQAAAAQFDKAK